MAQSLWIVKFIIYIQGVPARVALLVVDIGSRLNGGK